MVYTNTRVTSRNGQDSRPPNDPWRVRHFSITVATQALVMSTSTPVA